MDGAVEALVKGIGCLCFQAYREINHVKRIGDYAQEMKNKIDEVQSQIDDIKNQCQERPPVNIVRTWLEQTETGLIFAKRRWVEYQNHQQKRCFFGWCPDCLFQRTMSKQIRASTADLDRFLDKKRTAFPSSGDIGVVPAVRLLPTPKLVGSAFQQAQSQIQIWLEDDKTGIIGVYGMGGVGKSSLLETINNAQIGHNSPFDRVIFVTVSQNANIGNIQRSIATRLGLKLNEDTATDEEHMRAVLYNFLKGKIFLLILDDMWSKIDLYKLGVGVPEKGSKILLSTRTLHVCREMMTDKDILLRPLLTEEAWELFTEGAFRDGKCPEGLAEVASKVSAECAGLPLAIKAVAAAMRNNTHLPDWRRALDFLERGESSFYGGESTEEEEVGVLKRLEWSYNQLPNDKFKMCLVYCAAYPEDFWIERDDLIRLWMGEGLVEDTDRGQDILIKLTDRCLLEWRDCTDPSWEPLFVQVRMHELIRELAIAIGARQNKCIFRAGKNITHEILPSVWKYQRISLMDNQISSLPRNFNCPNLVSLLLSHNSLTEVDAIMNISTLKVLDLSHTQIEILPESISQLQQLVFLNLSYAPIKALPKTMVDLCNLRVLVLRYCWSLSSLPAGIEKLTCLNHLDLFGSYRLRSCPYELSSLTSLQTLRLYRCLSGNEKDGAGEAARKLRTKDLVNLKQLRELQLAVELPITKGVMETLPRLRVLTLHCGGTNQEDLPQDIYHINVHEYLDLTLFAVKGLPDCVCDFVNMQSLRIRGCEKLEELPELAKLPMLAVLEISKCRQLKNLGLGFWSAGGFRMLEYLSLSFLPELEYLSTGEVDEHAMQILKRLDICNCKQLKSLPEGLDRLTNLNLRALFCDDEFWNGIIWQQDTMKNNLGRIRRQKIMVENNG